MRVVSLTFSDPTLPPYPDSENKATSLNIFSFSFPHHLPSTSWMGFFVSFVSTFAAAPMVAIIREDLELTKPNLGDAGLPSPAPSSPVSSWDPSATW